MPFGAGSVGGCLERAFYRGLGLRPERVIFLLDGASGEEVSYRAGYKLLPIYIAGGSLLLL